MPGPATEWKSLSRCGNRTGRIPIATCSVPTNALHETPQMQYWLFLQGVPCSLVGVLCVICACIAIVCIDGQLQGDDEAVAPVTGMAANSNARDNITAPILRERS